MENPSKDEGPLLQMTLTMGDQGLGGASVVRERCRRTRTRIQDDAWTVQMTERHTVLHWQLEKNSSSWITVGLGLYSYTKNTVQAKKTGK
jgi:hypothetical protein